MTKILISNIHKQLIQPNSKKKKKKSNLKMGRRPEQTFSQRNADGQQAHEKMLNITNHQGNTNQNHKEISHGACQNSYRQKDTK